MGKSKGEPDRLIGAFEKAVAHGFGLRDRVLEAWRDPFEYGPLLDKALAPYHSVLADFFVADTDKWDEQDRDNLLAAQALAEHQLGDLLKLDEEAPDILADQTIMIENDGTIIRKEEPDGKDGGRVKAPAHCCFTRLRLKNIHNRKIKVTARARIRCRDQHGNRPRQEATAPTGPMAAAIPFPVRSAAASIWRCRKRFADVSAPHSSCGFAASMMRRAPSSRRSVIG